jgi:hypothetical protein
MAGNSQHGGGAEVSRFLLEEDDVCSNRMQEKFSISLRKNENFPSSGGM